MTPLKIRKNHFTAIPERQETMKPDMMKRYLILLAVLVICAGAAWYLVNASDQPAEDAVLAYGKGARTAKQAVCARSDLNAVLAYGKGAGTVKQAVCARWDLDAKIATIKQEAYAGTGEEPAAGQEDENPWQMKLCI